MWGHRLVVPSSLQKSLLAELHEAHMGIVRMKALARSYIWWPNIDRDVENLTKECRLCLENSKSPPRSQLHVWDWPDSPNERIYTDFLGPLSGDMYIIIVDAHSKWVDIRPLRNITTESTIKVFKETLAPGEFHSSWFPTMAQLSLPRSFKNFVPTMVFTIFWLLLIIQLRTAQLKIS